MGSQRNVRKAKGLYNNLLRDYVNTLIKSYNNIIC